VTAKKTKKAAKVKVVEQPKLLTYKGMDKNFRCLEFQYEVGKSYAQKGKTVVCCKSGSFHSVEMPLDAFTYYGPATSRYALTEISGPLDRKGDDTKVASLHIAINAELKLPELIAAGVKWILASAKTKLAAVAKECAAATGDSGHAAATGYSGHAAATGYSGHAAATGNCGHAAATGNCGTAFAGFGGRAKSGANGAFAIAWFDQAAKRARLIVGTPGENGIKPDTFYSVNDKGELVEVKQ